MKFITILGKEYFEDNGYIGNDDKINVGDHIIVDASGLVSWIFYIKEVNHFKITSNIIFSHKGDNNYQLKSDSLCVVSSGFFCERLSRKLIKKVSESDYDNIKEVKL